HRRPRAAHARRRLDQRRARPGDAHPVQQRHQRGARPAIRARDRAAQRRQPQRGSDPPRPPADAGQRDPAAELMPGGAARGAGPRDAARGVARDMRRRGDGRSGPSILVVDNYDSFTWNLVHYLREIGAEVRVARNDALSAADAVASGAEAVLISPGPGIPDEAGISLDLV